jgi:hypothetical protein
MDCHEPHALKLRAEGNALCTRCHNAAKFDTEKHHFHKQDSNGVQCMNCHAPVQNYMVIDRRRDHSFRLPRPDLSLSLGSPNACTQCHQKHKHEWAATALDKWYGKTWRNHSHYGTTLHAGAAQGIKALPALLDLAQVSASPALVRATALILVSPLMQPELLPLGDHSYGMPIIQCISPRWHSSNLSIRSIVCSLPRPYWLIRSAVYVLKLRVFFPMCRITSFWTNVAMPARVR